MIHTQLSTMNNSHYGVGTNFGRSIVLLQIGLGMEQLRVGLTSNEVDKLINDLRKSQQYLKKEKQNDE